MCLYVCCKLQCACFAKLYEIKKNLVSIDWLYICYIKIHKQGENKITA